MYVNNDENKVNKNRWIILFNVVLMTFMCCLDSSIVNVALPVMSSKLSVTMSSIEWVITSYLIVISATILIFGRLGDMKGKTIVFKFGVILFTIGSFLCGISNSLILLIVSRVIQAIGAAAAMATNQGIITQIFPANERGRALGISGSVVALGTMVGPPLGGLIVSVFSWKYIFLINVPIGIITFIISTRTFPIAIKNKEEKLDIKGAVLFSLAIVMLFAAINKGNEYGYTNIIIILVFIIAIVLFIIFILVEKKEKMPLIQLQIFENKLFSISIFCGFISFIAISSSNIIQPFYLQDVMKLSPAATGMFMMAYPIVLAIVAPASGYLSDKIGSEFLTFIGLSLTSVGLFLMASLNEHSSLVVMCIFIAIMSMGNGLFQSPNNSLIMSTVHRTKLGIAGSINALIRNLGMVFGISLSTTMLYNRMSYKIGYHVTNYVQGRDDVFIFAMRSVYISAGIVCVTGALITAARLYKMKTIEREI
jgi:EmrB/QacA subfamily drug resistance transporter